MTWPDRQADVDNRLNGLRDVNGTIALSVEPMTSCANRAIRVIQLAVFLKFCHVVKPTDMSRAKENLRHRCPAGPSSHFLTQSTIAIHHKALVLPPFGCQKTLGSAAVTTPVRLVHDDFRRGFETRFVHSDWVSALEFTW